MGATPGVGARAERRLGGFVEQVEVWRGRHGDPVPLFGPLPGVHQDGALAYEFQLPPVSCHGRAAPGWSACSCCSTSG